MPRRLTPEPPPLPPTLRSSHFPDPFSFLSLRMTRSTRPTPLRFVLLDATIAFSAAIKRIIPSELRCRAYHLAVRAAFRTGNAPFSGNRYPHAAVCFRVDFTDKLEVTVRRGLAMLAVLWWCAERHYSQAQPSPPGGPLADGPLGAITWAPWPCPSRPCQRPAHAPGLP